MAYSLCLTVALLCVGLGSYGQISSSQDSIKQKSVPDSGRIDQVSVMGYSAIQKVNRLAYNVTAIDATKLHNTTLDIAGLLDRTPGARLRQTGGLGSDFDLSIHGFSGKRIKYFLDGVPMDDLGAAFQINNIPVNIAERIEIYKGVVPVWLGSDVLGAAVNIITTDQQNYIDASYAYGSFNTHQSYINAAYTSEKGFRAQVNAFQNFSDNNYQVNADAADLKTGKYYENSLVRRFHDQYHNETVIAKVGVVNKSWADELLAGVTLGRYYKEIQTGARLLAVYGEKHNRGNILMPSVKYAKRDFVMRGLDVMLHANYNFGEEQSIDTANVRYNWFGEHKVNPGKGGEQWYSHYVFKNNLANMTATMQYSLSPNQQIALNSVYSHFDRVNDNLVVLNRKENVPQKANKHISGLSYQYIIPDRWEATVFGKLLSQQTSSTLIETSYVTPGDTVYNQVTAHRDKWGYGFATAYRLRQRVQVKLSYERTHRLPETDDIYGDMLNKEGNWFIKPESSNNLNLGANYHFRLQDNRFFVQATGVYYYTKDFIVNTFNSYTNRLKAENLLAVSNLGIEAEVRYAYRDRLTAGLNITSQNLRDQAEYRVDTQTPIKSNTYQLRIPNIPYLFGHADASYFFANLFEKGDKLTTTYNLHYINEFFLYWENEGAKDTKRTIPTQVAHDVNLTYSLKDGRYNISLMCNNLANANLYDNFSLQKPGRSVQVKIRYFIHKN